MTPAPRGSAARCGGLRFGEIRVPLLSPSQGSGGRDRSGSLDRGGLPEARGNRRIHPLAATHGQGGVRGVSVATSDGKVRQGYKLSETPAELVFRDPTSAEQFRVAKADIEEMRQDGSLMPEGLAAAMSPRRRRDLIRFLLDMGHPGGTAAAGHLARHSPRRGRVCRTDREPLHPELWPSWQLPVNRHRVYDWYAKQADYFSKQPNRRLCCRFPGNRRWSGRPLGQPERSDLGRRPLEPDRSGDGPMRRLPGAGVTVPKGGMRPARRAGRAGRLLQPRDSLLRGPMARRVLQVLGARGTGSWTV